MINVVFIRKKWPNDVSKSVRPITRFEVAEETRVRLWIQACGRRSRKFLLNHLGHIETQHRVFVFTAERSMQQITLLFSFVVNELF
jgi:hypothetical protein